MCFVESLSNCKQTNFLALDLLNVSADKELLDDDPFPSSMCMMSASNHNDDVFLLWSWGQFSSVQFVRIVSAISSLKEQVATNLEEMKHGLDMGC